MDQLLAQYNPHWEPSHTHQLIPRVRYSKQILELARRKEIVVLKGIRRSGKSSLLKLVIGELIEQGIKAKNILFMNLEDYRLGSDKGIYTLEDIYQAYRETISPVGKTYILLDEIQEIPGFEKWLRTYYEQNPDMKFMITGSSSSLFSAELSTLLTGRQIPIEIFPFSFMEFLEYKAQALRAELDQKQIDSLYLSKTFSRIEPLLKAYMDRGGFPEVVKHDDEESNILLLQQYISDILLKDIAKRYNIRKIEILQKLTLYLIFNMGNEANVSRIAQVVGSNRTTVLELIAYLKEVYLIFTTGSFSFSVTEQLGTTRSKKVYCIDNGLYAAIKTDSNKAFAKKLRNLVFQHLRFQWNQPLFYWKDKVDLDFVMDDGFPVSLSLADSDIEREITKQFHYLNEHNLARGLLINWSKLQIFEENERKILLLPLWLFLTKPPEEILEYGM